MFDALDLCVGRVELAVAAAFDGDLGRGEGVGDLRERWGQTFMVKKAWGEEGRVDGAG